MSRRRALAVAASVAVLVLEGANVAFVRTNVQGGQICLWWAARTIPYVVNDFAPNALAQPATDVCGGGSPNPAITSVQTSFRAWTQATLTGQSQPCTNLQLAFQGTTPSVQTGNDNQNLVVFRRGPCSSTAIVPNDDSCQGDGTCADKYNCWDHSGSNIIALTTTSYRPSTGEIIDADMELNAWDGSSTFANPVGYYFTCVDPIPSTVNACPAAQSNCCTAPGDTNCLAMDVQNTVTHEAGHFLGLGHTTVSNATMFANASRGETSKRTLAQDDVQGVCTIYPANQPTANCIDGPCPAPSTQTNTCVSPSKNGGCSHGPAGAGGLLLGLLGLRALRRSTRAPRFRC